MLKLITVNIEETKHYNRVLALLTKEKPDIVYLQEAPQSFSVKLTQLGFETSFAPMSIRTIDDKLESTGLMAASKLPFAHKTKYYHGGVSTIVEFDRNNRKETSSYAYIITTINTAGNTFNIATTHVMQTPDGLENDFQIQGINTLYNLWRLQYASWL